MPTTNNHNVTTGLVLDGHYGWHNHARMIAEAVGLGYVISDDDQAIVDRYDEGDSDPNGPDDEVVVDIMDSAERWLNEHTPGCCKDCGEPVESHLTGWWSHVGLRGQCWRLSDGENVQHYVWHWTDGEFFLSPMCDDQDCDDETCAHWSFQ